MTALQLNAELFRELSVIAEDENLMKQAVKAIKKLASKKQAQDETEYIMSSPAMVDILRQGDEDIKNGKGRVVDLEDLWKWQKTTLRMRKANGAVAKTMSTD